jgi:NitT/TauT family transport system substrate-binding protein
MVSILSRLCAVSLILVGLAIGVRADDRFVVGTNWLPDAERGGFYQAEAAGIYRKYGL